VRIFVIHCLSILGTHKHPRAVKVGAPPQPPLFVFQARRHRPDGDRPLETGIGVHSQAAGMMATPRRLGHAWSINTIAAMGSETLCQIPLETLLSRTRPLSTASVLPFRFVIPRSKPETFCAVEQNRPHADRVLTLSQPPRGTYMTGSIDPHDTGPSAAAASVEWM
jgi:hypothetical protein